MNKIYKAFSNLKADEKLKVETYHLIIKKLNHKKQQIKFLYLPIPLTVLSIILLVVVYNYNDMFTANNQSDSVKDNIKTLDTPEYHDDKIIFNDNVYVIDHEMKIDHQMLEQEIGYIQLPSDNSNEIIINDYKDNNQALVYSIKNIDSNEKIAIIINEDIRVYKRNSK